MRRPTLGTKVGTSFRRSGTKRKVSFVNTDTRSVCADVLAETIVNNESSEIIRMFYTEFDALIPEYLRESSKGDKAILPEHLRKDIDAMNEWVYDTINNGVSKCLCTNCM